MRTLRIGDRHLVLVTGTQLEQWTYEQALLWLREAAAHWVGREALLRLSDRTLGPDDDLDAAIEHLAPPRERRHTRHLSAYASRSPQ